ncbi:DUF2332 domain-containing protein [Microbacterium esteraromaticum]|uniref:DUF2332 domain-containing protein n=1 Tax=Microbacterium esteraromaticum TaxID=57043 RepID=A0A7D7W6Q9_9MICO|nr:DUF2332 domain-containing protein [Microbacterium esteraromaticum]QMU95998.1 DUF2332 domain-containing protein [Microbacterium esteraromaticum]
MIDAVAERYDRFARDEAPGRSDVYAAWAAGVAGDAAVQALLARLSPQNRQPPLVFAVSRLLGAPVGGYAQWREFVLEHADELVAECGRRGVQINEPLRLAALLPALSMIDGPIALLELGAAAGLCLYPDRFSFRIDGADGVPRERIDPSDGPSPVLLGSVVTGELPPLRVPEVIWRAGVDLDPLDVRSPSDRAWLESLIWPGERERSERIAGAMAIVAADPPVLRAGDAAEQLEAVVACAPAGAKLVITTPGMLVYLPRPRRLELIERIRAVDAHWITIDSPGLHDGWRPAIDPAGFRGFAVALDGRVVADADPLGRWWEWRAGNGEDAA